MFNWDPLTGLISNGSLLALSENVTTMVEVNGSGKQPYYDTAKITALQAAGAILFNFVRVNYIALL